MKRNLDDVLLHYGVKGMKWDDKKGESEEDKKKKLGQKASSFADRILKDIKTASKKVSKTIDKAIVTPAEKKAKEVVMRKTNPTAAKLADIITKNKKKIRDIPNTKDVLKKDKLKKDNPTAAKLADIITKNKKKISDIPNTKTIANKVEKVEKTLVKSFDKTLKEVKKNKVLKILNSKKDKNRKTG